MCSQIQGSFLNTSTSELNLTQTNSGRTSKSRVHCDFSIFVLLNWRILTSVSDSQGSVPQLVSVSWQQWPRNEEVVWYIGLLGEAPVEGVALTICIMIKLLKFENDTFLLQLSKAFSVLIMAFLERRHKTSFCLVGKPVSILFSSFKDI